MYILAKLVFRNYGPLKLEEGMWFISKQRDVVYGKVYEYLQLHELNHVPHDKDSYISVNGFPVEPYIIAQNQNPDDKETVLVQPEQIGWFIDGYTGGHPIDIKDINYILENYEGEINIEVEDTESFDTDDMKPLILDGKVIIRAADDIPDDDWEEEEDWDDMDDDEWPYDHPKDKTDHDPEPNDSDHGTE